MKRIKIASACAVAAVASGGVATSASYADMPNSDGFGPLAASPFSTSRATASSASESSDFARETAALIARGIPPERARAAIALQGKVAQTGILDNVEAAIGGQYGGAWFEPAAAQLHIGVTSPEARTVAEGVLARAGLAEEVTLTSVRSSWAQLLAAQKQWNRRLANLFAQDQVQTAVSAEHNALYITLSESVSASERAALEHEASVADVNVVVSAAPSTQIGGHGVGEKTECVEFVTFKAYCEKPITSGVTIQRPEVMGSRPTCTAGPLAIPEANVNETYLLTAGHCGAETESWFSFYVGGAEHEIGKAKTFVWNLSGDYGEIPVENAAWKEAGNEPVFAVTAQWKVNAKRSYRVIREGRIAENMMTCHDGQTSGGTCGEIVKFPVTVRYAVGAMEVTVEGLAEVKGAALVIEGGDSGGPFFFSEANHEVLMQGLTVAVSPEPNRGWFEPLPVVLGALNLELLTKNNENRAKDKEEKEAKPNILPEGTEIKPLTASTSSGETSFGSGLFTVKSASSTGIQTTPGGKSGSYSTTFKEAKDTLGTKCTGEGLATAGEIIEEGTFHIRDFKGNGTLLTALIQLLKEVKFACGAEKVAVKGCLAGHLTPENVLTKALTLTFERNGTKNDNSIVSVLNEANSAEEACQLLSSKNGGAFELSSLVQTMAIKAFKRGTEEVAVLVMKL